MRLGIVGFGYWGQILARTLSQMGYSEIVVCDTVPIDWSRVGVETKYQSESSYEELNCDKVFIATPASTHYDICKHFLSQGVDVFCEKPLTLSVKNNELLYALAEKTGAKLFVDWVFLFNPQLAQVKRLIETPQSVNPLGSLKNVFMNRLNLGPVRDDVNARWDLASHDVSILMWLLGRAPTTCIWKDYSNLKGCQPDSVLGLLDFSGVNVTINASWSYPKKDRLCCFVFSKGLVTWDDVTKQVQVDALVVQEKVSDVLLSPLASSVGAFLNNATYDYAEQKSITIETTKILNGEYDEVAP